jgi:type IV fimbrial biogenesis protein FimT
MRRRSRARQPCPRSPAYPAAAGEPVFTEQPPISTFVQGRDANEGSPNAQLQATPGGATTVTFTPLGGIGTNADGSASVTRLDVTNPSGGACSPAGAMRCLRIVISGGGTVRMCDPHPSVVAPDPRAC